jgi:uncharacterized protein YbjT (DUF2867 family)
MSKRILITGANGNVGRATIAAMPSDVEIIAGVHNLDRTSSFGPGVRPVRFDFTEPATFDDALEGVEALLLVRPPQLSDVRRDILPFLEAARGRHIVFLSVMGVESASFIPHAKIETAISAYEDTPWTFLRPGFFFQNLSTTHAADIRDRNELFIPAGSGKTSFIDVEDIGAVAALALTEPGHTSRAYTLTGDDALTYDEVAAIMTEVLGRDIRYSRPNPLQFAWREWRNGTPLPYVLVMVGIYLPTLLGRTGDLTDTTERLLGRPSRSFRDFVAENRQVWIPAET